MKNLKILTALGIVLLLSSFTLSADKFKKFDWDFMGDKIAAFGPDRDVLHIRGNDNFRSIKIRVTNAPLYIYDMDVYFENGEKINVPLKNFFRQGDDSRVIDFPGGVRNVKKVSFVYDTKGRARGRARVAVWGQR